MIGLKHAVFHAALLAAAVAGLGMLTGCPPKDHGQTGTTRTSDSGLYQRLGGQQGIANAVDKIVDRVSKDDRVNARFKNADMNRFRTRLTNQITEISGGPAVYHGKDMITAHKGMNLSKTEFDAFMQDVRAGLTDAGVDAQTTERLMVKLEPMQSDIVGR